MTGIRYEELATGEAREQGLAGVFVQIGLVPNSQCVADILELNAYGEIVVDDKCRTSEPGIFACGDVTTVPYNRHCRRKRSPCRSARPTRH